MLIGEILISHNIITLEQLETALAKQESDGGRIGDMIIKLGFTSKEKIESALALA